jgi:hypothetical protein
VKAGLSDHLAGLANQPGVWGYMAGGTNRPDKQLFLPRTKVSGNVAVKIGVRNITGRKKGDES